MRLRSKQAKKAKYENAREMDILLQNLDTYPQVACQVMCSSPYFPKYPIAVAAAHPAIINTIITCTNYLVSTNCTYENPFDLYSLEYLDLIELIKVIELLDELPYQARRGRSTS